MIAAIVAERGVPETLRRIAECDADPRVGLLELRGDATDIDPDCLAGLRKPTIATFRRPEDGGLRRVDESERRRWLQAAAGVASTVDVEVDTLVDWRPSGPARVMASLHCWAAIPRDLEDRVRSARRLAPVVKIAARPSNLAELVRLLEIPKEGPTVLVGLGDVGLPLRWVPDRSGSLWTYARTESALVEAPGLSTLDRLCGSTGPNPCVAPDFVLGVVSDRALDSIGPAVYHRVWRHAGLRGVYAPFTTPDLGGLRELWRAWNLRGLSITTPFKEAARHVDPRGGVELQALERDGGDRRGHRSHGTPGCGRHVTAIDDGQSTSDGAPKRGSSLDRRSAFGMPAGWVARTASRHSRAMSRCWRRLAS